MAKKNTFTKGNGDNKPYKRSAPENETFKVSINDVVKAYAGTLDREDVADIISKITFDLVSIPLYAPKAFIYGDSEAKGKLQIGWINGWTTESHEFTITVMGRSVSKYKEMVTPTIMVTVSQSPKTNEILKVLSFDLTEAFTSKV